MKKYRVAAAVTKVLIRVTKVRDQQPASCGYSPRHNAESEEWRLGNGFPVENRRDRVGSCTRKPQARGFA